MTATDLSPWLVLAGLGAFHGVNPAMGWLFAVALGLHRQSQGVVVRAIVPIALGHALSIAVVAGSVVLLGAVVDYGRLRAAAGVLLVGWAVYHAVYGHRHRVRFGISTGMTGLAAWSFLMATGHGAGLMLLPVLIPLCLAGSPARELLAGASLPVVSAAVGVHTGAMVLVTGAVAIVVYRWVGLGFLRRGWINLDLLWIAALVVIGLVLLVPAL